MRLNFFSIFAFLLFLIAGVSGQVKPIESTQEQQRYRLAADYSKNYRGLSVLIIKGDKIVFEEYHNGFAAGDSQMLASGTKSFTGVMAVAAQEDRLLKLDEKVSETISEWKNDENRSKITIRQLLTLTSGIDTGPNGRPPAYSEAVDFDSKYAPGTTFEYGPVPFQIFGEVLRRKLKTETPLDYLKRRIFSPINLQIASWTHQGDQPNMPSGAFMTAREWAKFGLFLKNGGKWGDKQIVPKRLLDECFVGTTVNPNYGISFWLNRSFGEQARVAEKTNGRRQSLQDTLGIEPETTRISQSGIGPNLPKDLFMAAGAGKQRLYIIRSLDLVIVRQGRQSRFEDKEFLERLIFGENKSD
jgi:CubicO group peptidase (beta-lactamase class C family)